jgi:hypothetical protein
MKIPMKLSVLLTSILVTVLSCTSNKSSKDNLAPGVHMITAAEVIQGSNYTYLRATDDGEDYWMAIEYADIKKGGTYYWSMGAEMKEFTSKELKRTFRSIFFVQDLTDKPIIKTAAPEQKPLTSMAGKQVAPEQPGIKVPKAVGGMSVAELYEKQGSIAGKTIKVAGQVVKYSGGIMKKNWIHIQDGTKFDGKYDLTVSTLDSAKVGDVIIVEGVAAVKKDVGAGYFYEVLIEDARLKK